LLIAELGHSSAVPLRKKRRAAEGGRYRRDAVGYNHRETFSLDLPMKLARQQVLGSPVFAVIVLIILFIRAWPYPFHK
jgi:hypothetical protein